MTAQPPAVQPQPAPSAGQMTLGPFVSKAWALVTADLKLFIVGFLIVFGIVLLSAITVVGPIIIGGPLMFGFLRIVQKRYKGEPAEIGDVFKGFQDFSKGLVTFLLLFALGLAVAIVMLIVYLILYLTCVGIVLIPIVAIAVSLIIGAATFFVMDIAALSDVAPMDALKRSIKFCFANLWPMVLLSLVAGLIGGAGSLACGVGWFFSVPLSLAIGVIAYNEYYLPNAPAA